MKTMKRDSSPRMSAIPDSRLRGLEDGRRSMMESGHQGHAPHAADDGDTHPRTQIDGNDPSSRVSPISDKLRGLDERLMMEFGDQGHAPHADNKDLFLVVGRMEQFCSKVTTDEKTEILRSSLSRSRSDIDLNLCGSSSGSPLGPPSIDTSRTRTRRRRSTQFHCRNAGCRTHFLTSRLRHNYMRRDCQFRNIQTSCGTQSQVELGNNPLKC